MKSIQFYMVARCIARLRAHQPALSILPGLILGQVSARYLDPHILLLVILACVCLLVKAKNWVGTILGFGLGLLSSMPLSPKLSGIPEHLPVIVRIENQNFRYPTPGLVQFGVRLERPLEQTISGKHESHFPHAARLRCRAVNLPWRNVATIKEGELAVIKAKIVFFDFRLSPLDFDASMLRRGYSGTCKVTYLARLGQAKESTLAAFRKSLIQRYREVAGNDEVASLLLSLSLGVRDVVSAHAEREFKDLGITHVLVLSGMQVGLIFFGIAYVVRRASRLILTNYPWQISLMVNLIASTVSGLLVYLTDFEASASRAWIACVLIAFAGMSERGVNLWRGSLASFLVISLIWPGCWAEAGVQLSFAALFGLAIGQDLRVESHGRVILPCLLATAFTAVVAAAWFETLSISALLSNFIIAPWFGVLGCYLGFVLVIASYLSLPGVDELAMLARWIMTLCIQVVEFLHPKLPAPLTLSPMQTLMLVVGLGLGLAIYFSARARNWLREFNLINSASAS